MKPRAVLKILAILFLSASAIFLFPKSLNPQAIAAPAASIGVWDPDYHSSNITDLALVVNSQFTVNVNVTDTTNELLGFDVSLNYNITAGLNVLQAVHPFDPASNLAGGLFDPAGSYPTGCSVLTVKTELDSPGGNIRYAAVMQGGCTRPGTGLLFSVTFKVIGTGATSIDIIQAPNQSRPESTIIEGIGNPPATKEVKPAAFDAYFRNGPGIPPNPTFTFSPDVSERGTPIQFYGNLTSDPDNPSAPNGGVQTEPVVYDANNNLAYDIGDIVVVGATPSVGTPLGAPQPYVGCRVTCNFNLPDTHVAYDDGNNDGVWNAGESVVYDANLNLKFDTGDFVIAGTLPSAGASLKSDSKLTYVDSHRNIAWDDGYIWDWGDGSGVFSTGNVTSHVFQSSPTISGVGKFQVKLTVYDSDNSLPNRQIQIVNVGPRTIFDIAVFIEPSKTTLKVGETLSLTVTLTNRGNQPIAKANQTLANMNVTYDLNTLTTIDRVQNISLVTINSSKAFNYTINTSSLSPRVYTVTVHAAIFNSTTGEVIPNALNDNVRTQSFTVQGAAGGILSLPLILGLGVGAVAVVSAVVYVLRRRKPSEE